MGHEEIDIVGVDLVALEDPATRFLGVPHGKLEDVLAVLLHVVQPLIDGFMRGGTETSPRRQTERKAPAAIDIVLEIDDTDTIVVGCLYDSRAGAIAEQHAGRTIGVVDDAGHDISTDDQRMAAG